MCVGVIILGLCQLTTTQSACCRGVRRCIYGFSSRGIMTCGTKRYYFSVEFLRFLQISRSKTSWIDAKFLVSGTISNSIISLPAKHN